MSELYLCRFSSSGGSARLGLLANQQLYDLTATGLPEYASMAAWLQAAAGRSAEAMAALEKVPAVGKPVASAEALLDAERVPQLLCPLDQQEVWACGVTYKMSMTARMRESQQPTIYGRVYDAPRPEIFFKATPHRVVGPGEAVAVRADSTWDVPEPELALVVTPKMEIIGYTVGNDMSSRDIEGQNPLYLAQAKIYNRCCALGPLVRLAKEGVNPLTWGVQLVIRRDGQVGFQGETSTSQIHRPLAELVEYLGRCNSFPAGIFVVTGTGIVPPDTFTLKEGDVVEITIEGVGTLRNPVVELAVD
jgi:2-dehydro-3-deoxy-D-arabinonate dehydratase